MSDFKWNVILVGESGVGKTSLMFRYVKEKFSNAYTATVAIDYLFKKLRFHEKEIKLQIWDSAGQEVYKSIVPQYFRSAQGCILVYDVTNITTFHKLSGWLSEFRIYNEKAPVIIVGNKSEDPEAKSVSKSIVKSFAAQEGMQFIECSAKTGDSVQKAFELLLQKIWESLMPNTSALNSQASGTFEENVNDSLSYNNIEPSQSDSEQLNSFVLTESLPESKEEKKKKKCC